MSGADMLQSKDPAFKLFGRKIPLPDTQIPANAESKDSSNGTMKVEIGGLDEYNCREQAKLSASGRGKEENQAAVNANEARDSSRLKEDKAEANDSNQEKIFKKPEKILPCPRCNSFETKFCYFNNYNVNQPRHFCKNCQRYWTAGGTMRNVPIGAGRRKNKHLASQYCQILVSSDGMPVNRVENSEPANHQLISSVESKTALKPTAGNGMLRKFGSEAPLCKSMETLLNLGDRKRCVEMSSVTCTDNGEEPSACRSSVTASNAQGGEQPQSMTQKEQVNFPGSSSELRAPQPQPCYPVPPWVLPWSPSWKNVASTASTGHSSGEACITNSNNPNEVQWCPVPMVAVPGFCPPNIPLQFVPASYWDCMPVWAGTGNASLSGSNGCLSPSSSMSTGCCSGNGSPALGKHSREPNFTEEEKAENCILVSKTLRISDTNKSSKSSKWATSDLQPDQKALISSGAVFKAIASKADGKNHVPDATYILEANPAALSRSHTFQESS